MPARAEPSEPWRGAGAGGCGTHLSPGRLLSHTRTPGRPRVHRRCRSSRGRRYPGSEDNRGLPPATRPARAGEGQKWQRTSRCPLHTDLLPCPLTLHIPPAVPPARAPAPARSQPLPPAGHTLDNNTLPHSPTHWPGLFPARLPPASGFQLAAGLPPALPGPSGGTIRNPIPSTKSRPPASVTASQGRGWPALCLLAGTCVSSSVVRARGEGQGGDAGGTAGEPHTFPLGRNCSVHSAGRQMGSWRSWVSWLPGHVSRLTRPLSEPADGEMGRRGRRPILPVLGPHTAACRHPPSLTEPPTFPRCPPGLAPIFSSACSPCAPSPGPSWLPALSPQPQC